MDNIPEDRMDVLSDERDFESEETKADERANEDNSEPDTI